MYIHIKLNRFVVHQKLMQLCKSTILQLKKKKSKFIPKRNENIRPYKNVYMSIQSSNTHNSQKIDATVMSKN